MELRQLQMRILINLIFLRPLIVQSFFLTTVVLSQFDFLKIIIFLFKIFFRPYFGEILNKKINNHEYVAFKEPQKRSDPQE